MSETLDAQALDDVAVGAAILACGGGGDPYHGQLAAHLALEANPAPTLIGPGDLADDDLVVAPFVVGAPQIGAEKYPYGREFEHALRVYEEAVGRRASALMCAEIGGVNATLPLLLASRVGVPILDADLIGRAFPELHMTVLTPAGVVISPVAVVDEHGNAVVIRVGENHAAERLARAVAVECGAYVAAAGFGVSGRQARELLVHGTVSKARRIGAALREARAAKEDLVATILRVAGGQRLFGGKIVDVERRVERALALGTLRMEGLGEDGGRTLVVEFKNENIVARLDGELVATSPDLITVLDSQTLEAVTTDHVQYGMRVTVLGLPCDSRWYAEDHMRIAHPRAIGFDADYVPIGGAAGGR